MEDARKPSDYRKRSKSFSNSDVIRSYENTLYKVRSKKWAHPLGKAMSITGHILKMAGKWGAPFTGILGSALTVGSKLLNPDPNVARYIDLLGSVVGKKTMNFIRTCQKFYNHRQFLVKFLVPETKPT